LIDALRKGNSVMQETAFDYNSTGTNDVGRVRNNTELGDVLEAMKVELIRAREAGALSSETEAKARLFLTQAAREVRMPVPSKPTLIDHLNDSADCLTGYEAVQGMVNDLRTAVQIVAAKL
jgi:hypothetical protein